MNKLRIALNGSLLLACFVYGIGVGVYNWFPYKLIQNIQQEISHFVDIKKSKPNLTLKPNATSNFGYWHALNQSERNQNSTSNISQEHLNNFVFLWSRIDDSNIEKTADIKFVKDNILYINQNDPEILSSFGLTGENMVSGAGVKSVFEFNQQTFAYIAYVKKDCATADLVSLDSNEVLFNLGCIDPKNADLNAVGGAHLILNRNEFLLTTGTPTASHVENVINQNAQDDKSYWGKILKFTNIGGSLEVTIYSKGHRNPQGIFKSKDKIYSVEHGPMGGDEINEIIEGNNYGWPNQSFGSEYDLKMINKYPEDIKNYMNPLYAFLPSIGISYINECPHDYAAYYQPFDCLAVSSMRAGAIFFIVFANNKVLFSERIDIGSRIRKFVVSDNRIVALIDYEGVIVGEIQSLQ